MGNKLGGRRYGLPVLVVLLVACIFSLLFYPMTHMHPRGLQFAVLSLDEGMSTPAGDVNAGDGVVEAMVGQSDDPDATITWTPVDSQEALDAALADNEYYGAVIIPADFTARQAAAQTTGEGQPSLQVRLDNAKSPLVTNLMRTQIASVFEQMGVGTDIEVIHAGPSTAATNMIGTMLSQQLSVMPTVLFSLICSALLSLLVVPVRGLGRASRLPALGKQLGGIAVLSLLVGAVVWCMLRLIADVDVSAAALGFLWMSAAALMLVFTSAFDIHPALGALVAIGVFALGTSCGILPLEVLPAFWQDWVYGWVPQRFIGEGMRQIVYMGTGVWNRAGLPLVLTGCAGLVLAALSMIVPSRRPATTRPA